MTAVTPNEAARLEADHGSRSGRSRWVQSPWWDGFWMFSAIWGMAFLYAGNNLIGWKRASILVLFVSSLAAIYHSWSTTWMVLGSARMREARAENPLRYRVYPAVILAVSMAIGVLTGATLSFPSTDRYGLEMWPWIVYLALFWVGHFWHFGKQDFGVLSLYRARAGQNDLRARQFDQVFAFSMMFAIQPIIYLSVLTKSPLGQAFYSVIPIAPEVVRLFATAALAFATILTVVVVAREISRPDTSLPKLLYYGVMLVHPFVLYNVNFGLAYYYMIAYFWSHWFIAIGLVARINSGHYRSLGSRPSVALLRHFLMIGALVAAIAIVTANHSEFRIFSGGGYKEILARVTPEEGAIVGVFLGIFLAEQLLHYYCDRCLFRMRDPAIRKTIGPLL